MAGSLVWKGQDRGARERGHVPQHARVRQRQLAGDAQPAAPVQPADCLRVDGYAAAVDRFQFPQRRAGLREADANADALRLFDRRAARHRVGHGGGRRLCRIAGPSAAADAQPEHRPLRRALPRGKPGSDPRRRGARRQLLPAVSRLRQRVVLRELGTVRLQRAAGAGEPAVRKGTAVRRGVHALALERFHLEQRDRHWREHADRDLPESRHLELRPVIVRSDPRRRHQLHVGPAEGERALEQRARTRSARQLADLRDLDLRQRHAGLRDVHDGRRRGHHRRR